MKYELVCPDCGGSEFTRIWEDIVLFEGLESAIDSDYRDFTTTYWTERQSREKGRVTIRCSHCEFEVELTCSNDEDEAIIFNKLIALLIEEKCALEV